MQAKEAMNLIDFALKSHIIKALLPFQLLLAIACLIKGPGCEAHIFGHAI